MPSIGDTLREARMRQRLDIAEVEQRTKIRAKYLRALENEEFDLLPGPTFVKTFLRTYSEVLGLDPHLLVEEYRAGYEPRDELDVQPITTPAAERRGMPGPPPRGLVIGLAASALLIFLIVLGVTGENDGGSRQERAAEQPAETERERPRERRRARGAAPRSVTLEIAPSVPTYACVDNGPGTQIVFEGILSEKRSFRGRKLRINLGKSSVELTANGKKVPLEQTPNPVGWEFSPTGSKELPPAQRPCT